MKRRKTEREELVEIELRRQGSIEQIKWLMLGLPPEYRQAIVRWVADLEARVQARMQGKSAF